MIELTNFEKEDVRAQLNINGMRKSMVKSVMSAIGKRTVSFGDDYERKFSIIKVGKSYGVAKRCTYKRKKSDDEPRMSTGFTLALMRALDMLKENDDEQNQR